MLCAAVVPPVGGSVCREMPHVLAHGSLAALAAGDAPLVRVAGVRRGWGVGMENTDDLPGYRYFVRADDGTRPDVVVAYADLLPDPAGSAVAVVLEVDGPALAALDARERNYDRIDVAARLEAVEGAVPVGPVWAYLGAVAGRARLAAGRAAGRAVGARSYRDGIVAAYAARGVDVGAAFDDLPLRDLVARPVPPVV
jgi:hypothetical protein